MDWIVSVSDAERARAELFEETSRNAHAALREHGCVLLRGAFPSGVVDAMHFEYTSRYGSLDAKGMAAEAKKPPPNRFLEVGTDRYDIVLRMTGAFGKPDVFANSLLCRFLTPLLGKEIRLNSLTAVVSYPGALLQHTHRDYDHLYADAALNSMIPPHAINVAVPLIDVDIETGPTGVWLGSHMWPADRTKPSEKPTAVPFQRGDCLLVDYRTLHAGMPNQGHHVRPIVYMVYSRTWFFDELNHQTRPALDIPLNDYFSLPDPTRVLLMRAFMQIMRSRWNAADDEPPRLPDRAADNPPSDAKVGRNEPCPCGSGKRYKHCHGKLVVTV